MAQRQVTWSVQQRFFEEGGDVDGEKGFTVVGRARVHLLHSSMPMTERGGL